MTRRGIGWTIKWTNNRCREVLNGDRWWQTGGVCTWKPNRWVMEWAKGARGKRVSEMNACGCSPHRCKSPHLKIRAQTGSPLSQGPSRNALRAPLTYLGNAGDDIRVFGGVVFLVATEYSYLATLKNVNLQGKDQKGQSMRTGTDIKDIFNMENVHLLQIFITRSCRCSHSIQKTPTTIETLDHLLKWSV